MKNKFIGFCVLAIIGYIISFFIVTDSDVRKFNDEIIDILSAASFNYHPVVKTADDILNKYSDQEKVDLVQLNKLLKSKDAAINDVIASMRAVKIPDKPVCKQFHASAMRCLVEYKNKISKFQLLASYVESNNPAKSQENINYVNSAIDDINKQNDLLDKELELSQNQMAKEFELKLERTKK